jgi:SAM-dependent methyltransferase
MTTIVNVEQANAWNGDEGEYWVQHADRYDRAGRAAWQKFLAAAPIKPGDRVLDIGCGTGQSTRDAARAAGPDGAAHGVDLSAVMLDLARKRTADEGLTNVTYEQADAQVHGFERGAFDVVLSRMGAMFFADFVAAFTNIRSALRDDGRLALLSWRTIQENEWLMEVRGALAQGRDLGFPPVGAPSPAGLSDVDFVTGLLASAGFTDVALEPIDAPIWFGADADDAYDFMHAQGVVIGLTETLDDATRQRALDALRDVLRRHETPEGVVFTSASWLITATATPARP